MTGKKLNLISVGIFFLLLALTGIALGDLPPSIDMSVTKIARNGSHSSIQEVPAGSKFYYNISVINPDPAHHAVDVVVTDKLPYDAVYDSAEAQDSKGLPLGNATIHKTGDLLYVNFEKIPKGKTFYINITAHAPSEAPTTLYDIVNLRYANDPDPDDNTFTLATYVPVAGYGKPAAVESFEELLHNQTRLLFDFEDLLHVVPKHPEENYTFLASFEQLLRAQANLSLSFEDLLENEDNSGWDLGNFTKEQRVDFLKSFKRILWDEAFLFSSFEMKLKDAWMCLGDYRAPGHSQDAQTEFIASFEDLLKEQVKLFNSYQLLMKTIGDIGYSEKVDAFAAFENLLRVEANLLMSFEDVLKMKYKAEATDLLLTVKSEWESPSQITKIYHINLTNIGEGPITLTSLWSEYDFMHHGETQGDDGCAHLLTTGGQSPGWTDDHDNRTATYTDPLPTINPGETKHFKMTVHVQHEDIGHLDNDVYAVWSTGSVMVCDINEKTVEYSPPLVVPTDEMPSQPVNETPSQPANETPSQPVNETR